jgi:glycosyltransferase involved in cell wall biosynthesis
VIVDDGSKDDTNEIAARIAATDSRISFVRQDNAGVAAARNRGLVDALADERCRAVIALDADDLFEPNALEVLGDALARDPGAVAAHGVAKYIDAQGQSVRPGSCEEWCRLRRVPDGLSVRTLELTEPTTFASLLCVHGLPCPGVTLIRRSILERVGNYDRNIGEVSDWDMAVRLSRHGHLVFVNQVVTGYRIHDSNMTKNDARMREMTARGWRKALKSSDNTDAHRRAVRNGYRALHLWMASEKVPNARRMLSERRFGAGLKEAGYAVKHALRALRGRP